MREVPNLFCSEAQCSTGLWVGTPFIYKMLDIDFISEYNMPDWPPELQMLVLEFSGHVRRGSRSLSYSIYF